MDDLPYEADIICSIYYRYIIGQDVIDSVNEKIFNLYPSLLPQYRGCSNLTWAMINGEKNVGLAITTLIRGCDTGDIIIQKEIKIEDFDTQLTLYNRVMFESMNYFLEVVELVKNNVKGRKQEGLSSQYKRGCPFNDILSDDMDYEMIERFVRAMCYPPYPAARYNGKEITSYKQIRFIFDNENPI